MALDLQGDPKAGENKVDACQGCHGIKGYQASFPEIYRVPMLAGQNAQYIVNSLNAYRNGDRKHPTMRGIASALADQDMADIAAYYASLGPAVLAPETLPAASGKVAELLAKGACSSCHGANFSKGLDPSYPKLAGQNADYLWVALKSYKTENQRAWGRNNGIMGGLAKQFTNAELKELAKYLATQPGDLSVVPESRFR